MAIVICDRRGLKRMKTKKIKASDTTSYKMARSLRNAVRKCPFDDKNTKLLCKHALAAAVFLEKEAADLATLSGSVSHRALSGEMEANIILGTVNFH